MPNNVKSRPINSKAYWDNRFSTNWDENDGPAQSRFFARLALQSLPSWLLREIRREKLSLVDWGCAEGDGTNVLSESIDRSQLTGVDFSDIAIDVAKRRYQSINFEAKNWLEESEGDVIDQEKTCFDIVFSSNTLEHFHAPYKVLEILAERARKAVILALPFQERDRIEEHHASFLPENIPFEVNSRFQLIYSRAIDCRELPNTQWPGEQVILVYADRKWLSSLNLVLDDVSIEQKDTEAEISELKYSIDEQSTRLQELLANLDNNKSLLIESERQLSEIKHKLSETEHKLSETEHKLSETESEMSESTRKFSETEQQLLLEKEKKDLEIEFLRAQANKLESKIDEIWASTSWRITKPLRGIGYIFKSPLATTYRFGKHLYWLLPPFLRQALQGPRHRFVRYFRGLAAEPRVNDSSVSHIDLSWAEFNELILSQRESYKGIFVQELVIDWNVPLYQRPQHISAALGRMGYLVIYRTDNWAGDDVNGFREVADNVWITNRYEVDQVQGTVRSLYSTAYAHTPESVMKSSEGSLLVYEYIDHIDPEISGDADNVSRLMALKDFAFNGGADVIVASAGQLYDEAVNAVGENRVILAQNGVDTRHYRNPEHAQTAIPDKLEHFCSRYGTIVGYFGALAPWLWYDALSELIEERSDLGFVFIGPDYYGGAQQLPKSDNVLYLGAVDYKILPAYARRFDICFIPFKPGEIARTTSPLKLFEYFALEKPVVVTSEMRECVQYPEVFRGGSVRELSDALNEAIMKKDDEVFKKRLAELADENDWDERAKAISVCFYKLEVVGDS